MRKMQLFGMEKLRKSESTWGGDACQKLAKSFSEASSNHHRHFKDLAGGGSAPIHPGQPLQRGGGSGSSLLGLSIWVTKNIPLHLTAQNKHSWTLLWRSAQNSTISVAVVAHTLKDAAAVGQTKKCFAVQLPVTKKIRGGCGTEKHISGRTNNKFGIALPLPCAAHHGVALPCISSRLASINSTQKVAKKFAENSEF